MRFSHKIALRYLWARRSEAFVTIITIVAVFGVAIGVAVLTITMSVMTGFEYALRDKIVGSTHITVSRIGGQLENWQAAVDTISKVAEVKAVTPHTNHQALLTTGSVAVGVLVKGIKGEGQPAAELQRYLPDGAAASKSEFQYPWSDAEPQRELPENAVALGVREMLALHPLSAELGEDGVELPGLIIGRELSRRTGLRVGDAVTMLSPQMGSSPFGMMPRSRRFLISGVYASGLSGYEEALVYMDMEAAQRFFRMGSAISGLEVTLYRMQLAADVGQKIFASLADLGVGGIYVRDWSETHRDLWEALELEKLAYFVVLLLIIVMASFSIVTTLIMMVLEKRKDVAILKTMGATAGDIAAIFRFQGITIGILGTTFGLFSGYAGAVALREYGFPIPETVFPTSTLPIHLEPINFLLVGIAAFSICAISTWYPARRASRLEPVDVLRYE